MQHKTVLILVLLGAILSAGCQRDSRSAGETGATNQLGSLRVQPGHPGPPNVSTSDVPGSGRIDLGGGRTTGTPPTSSPSTNAITR